MIGNDAKAIAVTAMAKGRDNLRERLQLTTIDSSFAAIFGLRGHALFSLQPHSDAFDSVDDAFTRK
jgi:hypothetical protein